MSDNVPYQTTVATPASGTTVAAREASHGGDTSQVQVISLVAVTGSEGSRTIREVLIQDDTAFVPGTDAVLMLGAQFDNTGTDSVDEGDAGALRMSGNRNLYVNIRDNAGNERGLNVDASGNITVNVTGTVTVGSHAVTNAGTFAVQVDGAALTALQLIDNIVKLEDDASANGDSGVVALAIRDDTLNARSGTEGDFEYLHTNANGALWAEFVNTTIAATNAGTFVVQENGAALTALQLLDNVVVVLGTATYTEATSSGYAVAAVRRDADTPLANTTNEFSPLITDANGYLKVEIFDGGGSHTVDNAGTFAVQVDGAALTALQLIDNLVLLEDAVHSTGDPGIQMLAVRQDAQADFGADGDYVPLSVDADGQLRVNAGVVSASAASEYIDDADWTDSTSVHNLVGGLYQSVPQTVTDGDTGPFNMTTNGALHVSVQGTVTVASHAVTNAGTFAVQVDGNALTALQLIDDIVYTDDTSTHATGTSKGALIMAAAAPTDAAVNANDIGAVGMTVAREMWVSLMTAIPAGTNNIGDVDVLSVVPGVAATNLGKAEDAGHTTGDTGVFNLGVRVDTPNTALTNTDADYSPITTNKLGSLRVAFPEDDLATAATKHVKKYYTSAGAATDGIVWSPAAGTRWFLQTLVINVSAAATVTLEDDLTAGDSAVAKFELAANSGVVIPFNPPLFSGEDAADLLVTTSAGNVYITATGYEI